MGGNTQAPTSDWNLRRLAYNGYEEARNLKVKCPRTATNLGYRVQRRMFTVKWQYFRNFLIILLGYAFIWNGDKLPRIH
jgi:hypothetical protein